MMSMSSCNNFNIFKKVPAKYLFSLNQKLKKKLKENLSTLLLQFQQNSVNLKDKLI